MTSSSKLKWLYITLIRLWKWNANVPMPCQMNMFERLSMLFSVLNQIVLPCEDLISMFSVDLLQVATSFLCADSVIYIRNRSLTESYRKTAHGIYCVRMCAMRLGKSRLLILKPAQALRIQRSKFPAIQRSDMTEVCVFSYFSSYYQDISCAMLS